MERLRKSFAYAIQGILYSISNDPNMKIHLWAAAAVIIMGFIVKLTTLAWAVLILSIFMVLAAETINTAVEKTVDLTCSDPHPLAKIAKDAAAGGVLLTAVNAVVIGCILFGPYLIGVIKNL
jgi:diacylglycerol kinase